LELATMGEGGGLRGDDLRITEKSDANR
jgi:hypothetical protein